MGNWINKHIHKKKAVKILLFDGAQKQTVHYVVPKDDTFTIKDKGSFKLDSKNYFLDEKRFITYTFSTKTVEPVNPFDIKDRVPFSPLEFTTAIDSKVASEILNYSKKSMGDIGLMILGFLMIVGFATLYYVLNEQLAEINNKLQPQIVEVIE
jgi:hypothetical protein